MAAALFFLLMISVWCCPRLSPLNPDSSRLVDLNILWEWIFNVINQTKLKGKANQVKPNKMKLHK